LDQAGQKGWQSVMHGRCGVADDDELCVSGKRRINCPRASRGKTSIGIEEPPLFNEPGVFLVKPDGTLYYGAVQTMPFARPQFQDLLGAIDFAIAKDYPARGEYTGEV